LPVQTDHKKSNSPYVLENLVGESIFSNRNSAQAEILAGFPDSARFRILYIVYFYFVWDYFEFEYEYITRGQSNSAKAAPNDPTHTARAAELSRATDRLTDLRTDTAIIGNNSLQWLRFLLNGGGRGSGGGAPSEVQGRAPGQGGVAPLKLKRN